MVWNYRSSGTNDILIKGTFKNFNTIEDFRKVDQKKKLFDETVDRVSTQLIFLFSELATTLTH